MIRFAVAGADHGELRAHCIALRADVAWADVPPFGHVFFLTRPRPNDRAEIAAHPKATLLPHPLSPAPLTAAQAVIGAHVGVKPGDTAHALFTALHATHGHPLLDPEI